jgi:transposase
MPATVIAERIGWTRSIRTLSARVAEFRPVYLPPDPASRTAYAAGEIAQCDLWFPPAAVPVGFGQVREPALLPVLTMICAYSRWLSAMLAPGTMRRRSVDPSGWGASNGHSVHYVSRRSIFSSEPAGLDSCPARSTRMFVSVFVSAT